MNISKISRIALDFCNAYEIDQDDFFSKGVYYDKKFNNFVENYDIFLLGRNYEKQEYIEAEEIYKIINISLAEQLDKIQATIEKNHLQRFFK